ncbi:hypothetical protein L6452_20842 [Arctium lappa]|uniref:Uncharacterized protein n=1 Tax=Arctium lappa TaxID=4217 RepID=A0ACB9BDU0_ARCLA|nr:hypothetical protein L6452_20842 [Arctium lappa]
MRFEMRSPVRFGRKGKLRLKYVGPYAITERVGEVTYKLDLTKELRGIHPTFHISNLRNCLTEEIMAVPLDDIRMDEKLNYVEEPICIVDRKVRKLRTKEIGLMEVRWRYHKGQEASWEVEADMRSKYPNLFDDEIPGTKFF